MEKRMHRLLNVKCQKYKIIQEYGNEHYKIPKATQRAKSRYSLWQRWRVNDTQNIQATPTVVHLTTKQSMADNQLSLLYNI